MTFGQSVANVATFTSAVAIIGSLISVGFLFNDLNQFHEIALEDMQEFRVSCESVLPNWNSEIMVELSVG